MARKVVGRIGREMNREYMNYDVPKTSTGAVIRKNTRVSAPKPTGGATRYYHDKDEDI